MRTFSDITKTIGNTPLVRVNKMAKDLPAEIYLKLEALQPNAVETRWEDLR